MHIQNHSSYLSCTVYKRSLIILFDIKYNKLVEICLCNEVYFCCRAVVNFLNNCGNQLQELHLDGEELTDASINAICECSVLHRLKISFSGQLTDNCLSSLKVLPI